jgi:hypothetical protein
LVQVLLAAIQEKISCLLIEPDFAQFFYWKQIVSLLEHIEQIICTLECDVIE